MHSSLVVGVVIAASLTLAATRAEAQSPAPPPSTTTEVAPIAVPTPALAVPPAPVLRPGARFRFGIGGQLGGAGFAANGGFGIAGLVLDLGVQANDSLGVYAMIRAGSLIFANMWSIAAVAEWTPVERFSIGTGVGFLSALSITSSGAFSLGGNASFGLAIPLVLGFNFPLRFTQAGYRSMFRFAIEAQVAPGVGSPPGGAGGLTFAWARM